jgi:hypothetical protein
MNMNRTSGVLLALIAVVVFVLILQVRQQSVEAQGGGQPATAGRYSVSESQGHNLIVTDNKTNILYFYTIEKDKEIGSELKLRGSMWCAPQVRPVRYEVLAPEGVARYATTRTTHVHARV